MTARRVPRSVQLRAMDRRTLAGAGRHTVHLQLGRRDASCAQCQPLIGAPALAGLAASWAERAQGEVTPVDHQLTERARLARPAVRWWWGWRDRAGHQGAECYLCSTVLASWDRRWPMPSSARADIIAHRDLEAAAGAQP